MSTTDSEVRLQLRPLGPGDLPRIMEIERVSFSVPWQRNTFDSLFRRNDTDLVGAERDGALVGYAVCWTILDEAELGNVAVAPEARGFGVADTLVRAVLERIRQRGARACFLEVRESNLAAQRLYRRRGFEVVGRRRAYYSRPVEDALVMRLQLRESP
ncbi:ribosomal protein S18-alanine N-acetyltransferase [soil metagenome]